MTDDTLDCIRCDCPMRDHVKLRYWFRCWRRHTVSRALSPWLSKIEDTSPW